MDNSKREFPKIVLDNMRSFTAVDNTTVMDELRMGSCMGFVLGLGVLFRSDGSPFPLLLNMEGYLSCSSSLCLYILGSYLL